MPELRALQLQLGLHLLGFYASLLKHFLLSSAVIFFHVLSTLLELAIRGYPFHIPRWVKLNQI